MLTINGTDLTTLGFIWSARRGPGLGGARAITQALPGAPALLLSSMRDAGQLSVSGWFSGVSHANMLARRDSIVALLRGECVIRFADIADREWVGVLDASSRDDALGITALTDRHSASLVFTLPSPAARAQAETVAAGAGPALVLGTAPSSLQVTVQNGAGATITRVIVRVRAGVAVLEELQWDGVVASAGALVLKSDPFEVTNGGANAIDGLTAASTFPIADPAEGADNLQVVVTGGSGVTIETRYRRRWW